MRILVAPVTSDAALAARATVRSATRTAPGSGTTVLDIGGRYRAVGDEQVVRFAADGVPDALLGLEAGELHAAAAELEPAQLGRWLGALLLRGLVTAGETVALVRPGVELLGGSGALPRPTSGRPVLLVPRLAGLPLDGRAPARADALREGTVDPGISVWAAGTREALDALCAASRDWRTGARELDLVAGTVPFESAEVPGTLLGRWSLGPGTAVTERDGTLLADGRPVAALDLTRFDHRRPWVLDPHERDGTRALLSEHPALARRVAAIAAERSADEVDLAALPGAAPFARTAAGGPVHPHLRSMYRRRSALAGEVDGAPDDGAPDLFSDSGTLARWLLEPLPPGHPRPVARYLAEAYAARPDLRDAFPLVPGQDTDALLTWAETHGVREERYDAELVDQAVDASRAASRPEPEPEPGPPADGLTVIGYLAGELGVGESARLVLAALTAADVPHATVPVAHQLQSRQRARFPEATSARTFATTLLCVNADQTPGLVRSLGGRYDETYRVGMWYWEVEDFPAAQHDAFAHVDEVWAATDFIRDALLPHAGDVPVLTVPPPLPQRSRRSLPPAPLPGVDPDRPVLLFAFDHLSSTERKNPWATIDAFCRAFAPEEGPVLVLKSINADRDVPSAERLRLLAAARSDIVLVEGYLDADERDALMARCTAYVSLHRAEGLGLTMAEAMSWGKPVVATGYSGNLQFMTPANSVLVPWTPARVPAGCTPYPEGTVWADPDVDAAAAALRRVVEEPGWAAGLGERAAHDVRTLHSPEVAGARIRARLDEIAAVDPRRAPSPTGAAALVGRARRVLRGRD